MDRDVIGVEIGGDRDALARFRALLGRRRGLRLKPAAESLLVEIDAEHIEAAGPLLEAAATASGTDLRLVGLDATVITGGLEGRPSGVWAAIGDAATEIALARERGERPTVSLFGHLSVVELGTARFAADARPARAEPADFSARYEDELEAKLDDADWHAADVRRAGQPPEQAWTHMALFMTWLVRRQLVAANRFTADELAAVRAGGLAGERVLEAFDYKLLADTLTEEGSAFARDRYRSFLGEFERMFADYRPYSVMNDAATYARVEPVLNRLWDDWQRERRR